MATTADFMNNHKVLVDQTATGVIYIGVAKYPRPEFLQEDQGYKSSADTDSEIRKIKKITEDDGITEVLYPNGDYSYSFSRDDRASYTYK